jgi:hypothetical protein
MEKIINGMMPVDIFKLRSEGISYNNKRMSFDEFVDKINNEYDSIVFSTIDSLAVPKDYKWDWIKRISKKVVFNVHCVDTMDKNQRLFRKDSFKLLDRANRILCYRKFDLGKYNHKKVKIPIIYDTREAFFDINAKRNIICNSSSFNRNKNSKMIIEWASNSKLLNKKWKFILYVKENLFNYKDVKLFRESCEGKNVSIEKGWKWEDREIALRKCKFAFSLTKLDIFGTMDYATLDAISYGAVPIITEESNHDSKSGYEFITIDSVKDAKDIDAEIKVNQCMYERMICHNFDIVMQKYNPVKLIQKYKEAVL